MTLENLKAEAASMGYQLRRVGSKREYKNSARPDGTPILDYFHPHIRMRASEYARTRKLYASFRNAILTTFGREIKGDGELYRHYLLLLLEHCARSLKIKGQEMTVVMKLMLPLPKNEWLKPVKTKTSNKNKNKSN